MNKSNEELIKVMEQNIKIIKNLDDNQECIVSIIQFQTREGIYRVDNHLIKVGDKKDTKYLGDKK